MHAVHICTTIEFQKSLTIFSGASSREQTHMCMHIFIVTYVINKLDCIEIYRCSRSADRRGLLLNDDV